MLGGFRTVSWLPKFCRRFSSTFGSKWPSTITNKHIQYSNSQCSVKDSHPKHLRYGKDAVFNYNRSLFHSTWSETTQIPKFEPPIGLSNPHLPTWMLWTQTKHLLNEIRTAHNRSWKQLNVTCMMPKTKVIANIVVFSYFPTDESDSRIRGQHNN